MKISHIKEAPLLRAYLLINQEKSKKNSFKSIQTEISKMTDEELINKGYHVYYAGHNRSVIPPSDPLKAHFDNIKTNK
jgi:uncharacterized protein YqgQ